MKDDLCPICKFHGRLKKGDSSGIIFQKGRDIRLSICYVHSVELFRKGQMEFLLNHKDVFLGYELLSVSVIASCRRPSSLFST
jgi:hypothetical protein